jgi:hypothetical protein
MSRLFRAGDALSQFFNVLIFNGDSNYSISGEAYRKHRTILRGLIDILFMPFGHDHCYKAYQNDVAKAEKLLAEVRATT